MSFTLTAAYERNIIQYLVRMCTAVIVCIYFVGFMPNRSSIAQQMDIRKNYYKKLQTEKSLHQQLSAGEKEHTALGHQRKGTANLFFVAETFG